MIVCLVLLQNRDMRFVDPAGLDSLRVKDGMTSEGLITGPSEYFVRTMHKLLAQYKVEKLPLVDAEGVDWLDYREGTS